MSVQVHQLANGKTFTYNGHRYRATNMHNGYHRWCVRIDTNHGENIHQYQSVKL